MEPHVTQVYVLTWATCLSLSLVFAARDQGDAGLFRRPYFRFMTAPWKLSTLAVAMAMLVAASPYAGDPTWDAVDSVLMSATVYWLAPWSVAILVRDLRSRRWGVRAFAAIVLLFSPSWVFDVYVLCRHGEYPATWAGNLAFAGLFAAAGGLFWNLGWRAGEPSALSFAWSEWPPVERTPFRRVALWAVLVALPVAATVVAVVWNQLAR
jgi:hypothetical protein